MSDQRPKNISFDTETAVDTLIQYSLSGDENAFEELVHRYEKQVYNAAFCMTRNREDSLDIAQEVFVKVWRGLSKFRGDCSFATWIARITRNTATDYLRTSGRSDIISLTDEDDDGNEQEIVLADTSADSDPVRSYERDETVALVREAIASLPPPAREVIILREIHQMSYEDIANTLGIEEGTVKSRLNRAKKSIKEFLMAREVFGSPAPYG